MKFFPLIISFLVTLLVKPPIVPIISGGDDVTLSVVVEPFSTSERTSYICYSLDNVRSTNTSYRIDFAIVNDLYPNGKVIESVSGKAFYGNHYIAYDNSYTRSSNQLKITFVNDSTTETYIHEIPLVSRNSFVARDKSSVTMNCLTSCYGGTWKDNVSVTYTFSSFPDVVIPTYYHELDISDFYLTCSDTDFVVYTVSDVNLVITNREGLFDDFYGSGGTAVIPLAPVCSGNKISFRFKNPMYVDPTNLLMSSTPKEGYVKTKHLYFPKNEMRYQGDFVFSIRMSNFGVGKYSVTSSHKVNALINTLGDCYNSEYCILNKDARVNDIGWVI